MSLRDLPRWALLAKKHKQQWMACGDVRECPPALIPEGDDGPMAFVLVIGGKQEIYQALRVIRYGIDPVAVTLVQEAYSTRLDDDDPAYATLRRGMEDGSTRLSDLAASGGLARGDVGEAMFAHRILRDGSFDLAMIPFAMVGSRVAWDDRRARLLPGAGGAYPDLVKEAMSHPPLDMANLPGVSSLPPLPDRHARLLMARGVLSFLHDQPAYVVAPTHPAFVDLRDPGEVRRKARPDPARAKKKR